MAQQLSDILAQLDPVYNPQKQLIQSQVNALPQQQQAEQQGLDQAKTNAFSDIVSGANDRGMAYSGLPISEQAKYLGTTYLPAVAGLKNTYANKGTQLQQSLLGLNADEMKQAQGVYTSQVNAEVAAQQKQRELQQQMALEAYKANLSNQGNMALASAFQPSQQKASQPDYSNSVSLADLQHWLPDDYAARFNTGYTERTAIPNIQKLYPNLDPNEVKALVYQYRKQRTGT